MQSVLTMLNILSEANHLQAFHDQLLQSPPASTYLLRDVQVLCTLARDHL